MMFSASTKLNDIGITFQSPLKEKGPEPKPEAGDREDRPEGQQIDDAEKNE